MRFFTLFFFFLCYGCSEGGSYQPHDGDIIFQVSKSAQSRAIQLATKSKYSHVGIVFMRDGVPVVEY